MSFLYVCIYIYIWGWVFNQNRWRNRVRKLTLRVCSDCHWIHLESYWFHHSVRASTDMLKTGTDHQANFPTGVGFGTNFPTGVDDTLYLFYSTPVRNKWNPTSPGILLGVGNGISVARAWIWDAVRFVLRSSRCKMTSGRTRTSQRGATFTWTTPPRRIFPPT